MSSFAGWIQSTALALGGPGLFIVGFLDSSFLSLPEINDILLIWMVTQHKARMPYCATASMLGSVAGCLVLYYVGRASEHWVARRFSAERLERTMKTFQRFGVMAVLIPSLLPPPAPFKVFVLLAGVAEISVGRFALAIAIGRGVRYFGEGLLAVWFGDAALEFIRGNGRSIAVGLVLLLTLGLAGFVLLKPGTAAKSLVNYSNSMIDLSVVIPVHNEEENLEALHKELTDALNEWGRPYEVIVVDDGSSDGSFEILERLQRADPRLRVIRFRRNFGQTAAFSAGFVHARGRIIVTSDGDLQNDPRDIEKIVRKLEDEQLDIVCGWRRDRKDAFVSRLVPSFFANGLISWATGVKLHDYGCSLKAFRAEVVKSIKLHGEMHRFIPAIASEQGVAIGEAVVNHRPRLHGRSKYGISRTIRVVLDLLTVKFLLSYSTRPLQIFGLVGLAMAIPGFLVMVYLTYAKFVIHQSIANRPLLWFGFLLVSTGVQLLMAGLLAELQSRTYHESQNKPTYVIREIRESPALAAPAREYHRA